jgi:hypothetical protein
MAPMPTIKITVMGQKAELVFAKLGRQKARGLCDPPGDKPRRIWIDPRLEGKELAEVVIHECVHLACWFLEEDFVEQLAADIADVLEEVEDAHDGE